MPFKVIDRKGLEPGRPARFYDGSRESFDPLLDAMNCSHSRHTPPPEDPGDWSAHEFMFALVWGG